MKFADFFLAAGDDDLAHPPVGYAVRRAQVVQHPVAPDAKPCLEGIGGIVKAPVNYFAVSRRRFPAESVVPFQQDDIGGVGAQPGRNSEPHDACADDYYVGLFHENSKLQITKCRLQTWRFIYLFTSRRFSNFLLHV
jgi:hypothetical protein